MNSNIFQKMAVATGSVFITLGAVNTQQAVAITLSFDEFSNGAILSVGSFDALGVRFEQDLQIDGSLIDRPVQSPPNNAVRNIPFGEDITGLFLGPVTSVNFISVFAGDFAFSDIDTVTLRGFDAFNNLVASSSFTGITAQTLSISGSGITRFEIDQEGIVGIDDFTFIPENEVQSVPEPALSLGMLAMSIFGISSSLKRRHKQKNIVKI